MSVLVDAKGRYWVLSFNQLPAIFSASGAFIAQLGRSGRGPGEFMSAGSGFSAPGDSMVIFDQVNSRASIVSSKLVVARTLTVQWSPPFGGAALAWPTNVLMSAWIPSARSAGWPLHSVNLAGNNAALTRSFVARNGELRPGNPLKDLHHLSEPFKGTVWSGAQSEYTVFQWASQGLLRVLERRPSWFASRMDFTFRPDVPPPSLLTALAEDSTGLLWVALRTPATNWRAAWRPGVQSGQKKYYPAKDYDEQLLWQSMIEVLDPAAGRVVNRTRVAGQVISLFSNNRIAIYSEDADGVPHVRISRLSLSGR